MLRRRGGRIIHYSPPPIDIVTIVVVVGGGIAISIVIPIIINGTKVSMEQEATRALHNIGSDGRTPLGLGFER